VGGKRRGCGGNNAASPIAGFCASFGAALSFAFAGHSARGQRSIFNVADACRPSALEVTLLDCVRADQLDVSGITVLLIAVPGSAVLPHQRANNAHDDAHPLHVPRDARCARNVSDGGRGDTALTADGERLGATISSFNSVSLDPPLILFSLAREARSIDAWTCATQFAVSVLGEHQSQISTRFART
jgi:hypothetical protein